MRRLDYPPGDSVYFMYHYSNVEIHPPTLTSLIVSILASLFVKKEIHAKENNFTVPNFARTSDITKRETRMDIVNTFTFSVES